MTLLIFLINILFYKSIKGTWIDLSNKEGVNYGLLAIFIDLAIFYCFAIFL